MSISSTLEEKIKLKLEEKVRQNSLRTLNLNIKGIDFSSNDYLGFAKKKIFLNEQIGSTGSRLISGNSSYHLKLERKIVMCNRQKQRSDPRSHNGSIFAMLPIKF